MKKPAILELGFSQQMIEDVFTEFERDNPGKTHHAIEKDDFTNRLMAKIKASAKLVEGGNA